MILQALTRYYDILARDPDSDIAPLGYSAVGVSFALNLSAQGELLDVFPLFEKVQQGKKEVERPRRMIVPEQVKKTSGISSNFLCENSAYILGITDKGDTDFGIKRFEAFRLLHKDLLAKADCDASRAVIAYLDRHDPLSAREHLAIGKNLETILKGGNLVFMFRGGYVHDDPAIRQIWEAYKAGKDAVAGQCLVTGEVAPIARLHPSLKGIRNANPMGASLVGFNARAYESYYREQGQNSPVSEKAAFGYTTALNFLLSSVNTNKKFIIGDTTVVYWAESERKEFASAFASIFDPEYVEEETAVEQQSRKKVEEGLKKVAEKVKRVQVLDLPRLLADLHNENPRFYVLGLAPNAARVSVRFFINDPFQQIVERIMGHYRDLEIVKEFDNQPTYITIRHILDETVSKKARDAEASPLMAGALFRAILTNTPYPAALYYAIINRIRADMDDSGKRIQKVNYVRTAVIKAFLLRKYRHQPINPFQEVLVMSLNEHATIPAYVLGRLFAVLERAQQDAIGDVNASIKDRYFTSACATPASTFPILLRLSQHHISKVRQEGKRTFNYDRRIQDILNLLEVEKNPIPARLTLDEQGVFILGYYHQRKDFFTAKGQKADEPVSSDNE
ncbi:MAG: type I-C CRISPR-associated protein Cas8c/Csd1 [Anaerolineae bacterium]|nr:type I-C CRISPR-associated protein Cas8c/Csd1 [Anaerolineae bacterium]